MKLSNFVYIILFVLAHTSEASAPIAGRLVEAQGLLYRKEYAKAEEQFRLYFSQSELSREAALGLASALQGQGKFDEAVEVLAEHLARNPLDVPALVQLADLRLDRGQGDLAKAELQKVKVLRPGMEGLEEGFAKANALLGQKEEAASELASLRDKARLSRSGYLLLAQLKFDLGDFPTAEAVLRDVEAQFSADSGVYAMKARVLRALKRKPEAEVAFRRAIQAGQRDPQVWFTYADFLQEEKRVQEAKKILESALALNPAAPTSHIRLAENCELAEEYPAAEKYFSSALSLAPGDDTAMFGLVRVEEKSGSMDKVGLRLQGWLAAFPEKSWVAISYARLLVAIGNRARAIQVISASERANPGAKELSVFLAELKNGLPELSPQPASVKALPSAVKVSRSESVDEYVVQKGELLGTISEKVYGTTKHWRKIFDANRDRLRDPEDLTPGQRLKIPRLKGQKVLPRSPQSGRLETDKRYRIYLVKRNEILSRISLKVYGTSKEWKRIFEANRKKLRRPNSVFAGMKLRIPPLEELTQDIAIASAPGRESQIPLAEEPIIFKSAAPARKNESLLVSPEAVRLPDVTPAAPASVSADPEPFLPVVPRIDSGLFFSLGAAALRESIELEGTGFSASLPAKFGYLGSAEFGYRAESRPLEVSTRVQLSKTRFDGLTGVTPTSIDVERKRLAVLVRFPAGFWGLGVRLGYGMSWRSVAETAPRAFVTNRKTAGLLAGVGIGYPISEKFRGNSEVELFLPNSVEESGATTGLFRSGLAAEVGTELQRTISSSLTLAIGIRGRWEQFAFKGSGTRGTTDAKDRDVMFFVPLEARF